MEHERLQYSKILKSLIGIEKEPVEGNNNNKKNAVAMLR